MIHVFDILIRILIMILPVIGFMVDKEIDEWYGTLLNFFISS